MEEFIDVNNGNGLSKEEFDKYFTVVEEGLNEDSHTMQSYKDWINEPTFEEDREEVLNDIKNNACLNDGEKLELFTMINNKNKNECLNESNESSVPWVLQQGEDGELEYLGFFKNRDDALDSYDPSFVYESTYVNELDKETYLAMRDEGEFDYKQQKELNAFFGINEEPTVDKYGGRFFLEDEPGHSVYRGAFASVEKAKQKAEEDGMAWWRVVGYNYETDKWDVLAQGEDIKNEEFKDYNPDDVPEDDTEDYEDHILHSHEEFDFDDTENESLESVLDEDVKDWNSQAEKDKFAKHCHMFGLEPEDQFEVFISEQGNEEQILGIIKPYSNEPSLIIKNLQTNVEWAWNQRIFRKLFGEWKKDRYAQYGSKEADYDEEEREENEPQFEPVNPPVNLYDYLKENSNGAWISFTFDLEDGHDWQTNYCHGVNDFRDPELLKQYEVTEERCDYVSLDQGSSYTLKVRKIANQEPEESDDDDDISWAK